MMPPFAWERCTVFRGPAMIGAYPIGISLTKLEWPGATTEPVRWEWSRPGVIVWTVHPIHHHWYAAPQWSVPRHASSTALRYEDLWASVQQWPMTRGWRPRTGDTMGIMAVSMTRPIRSPVYWVTVAGTERRGQHDEVWEREQVMAFTPPSWWRRWWQRVRYGT